MKYITTLLLGCLLIACSNSHDDTGGSSPANTAPDFTAVDSWLQDLVDENEAFNGASMVIVDKDSGPVHQAIVGDHREDTVVLLASTSKVPTATLLLALAEDDANLEFAMDAPISSYLPWLGVWDDAITTEHLVSNRSGIPGLNNLFVDPNSYGAHLCQYLPSGTLLECAQQIYQTALPDLNSNPADTAFDYGGSQWTLAGAVAETVGGASWQQLWDQYVGEPCGLEVFRYGNMLSMAPQWDGNAGSLQGIANPNVEGGAISNLEDYAKIISMHLNDGACGDNQVLSPAGIASMRRELTPIEDDAWGYGLGWWVIPPNDDGSIYLYVDPGFYGSISWIDVKRQYGGVVLLEEYTGTVASEGTRGVVNQLIPLIEEAIDLAAQK